MQQDHSVQDISVAQLVEQRSGQDDPWRLALVQRHLVWDELRMAHLLDSLLVGYPIGSLLVCRVKEQSHVLRPDGGTRRAEKAREGEWQLIDGQQRVHALTSMLTDQGGFGRFYLHMTRERKEESVVTGRRDKRKALDYIRWVPDDTAEVPQRDRWINLSGLHQWARRQADVLERARAVEAAPALTVGLLKEIDHEFAEELLPSEIASAADRTSALLRAWAEGRIPVQMFTVKTPSDVLQVFARINLAGVRLDGEDVFFAAVKTLWPDAEEYLDRVADQCPLLNRMTALRLLARLASTALNGDDMLPLRVDRLNGRRGSKLVASVELMAADGSPVLRRIAMLSQLLTDESRPLGHALTRIGDSLFDHVFAWAAANVGAESPEAVRGWLPDVEAYLIGAQAFRYPTVFRDGFLRLAFAEAVAAGSQGSAFPLRRILSGVHHEWSGLRFGQSSVTNVEDQTQQRAFVDGNGALFLSVMQRIPYVLPLPFDWDHIYPQNLANRMRVKNASGYLIHHDERKLVWSAGNLWALDCRVNREAQDQPPGLKLPMLDGRACWPTALAEALSASERSDLLQADALLGKGDIQCGMRHFAAYTASRSDRILADIKGRFPDLESFAPHAPIDGSGFERARLSALEVRESLRLQGEAVEPNVLTSPEVDDPRFAAVLEYADRVGMGRETRAIINGARELNLHARPYQFCVMLTPPANKTRVLLTFWPKSEGRRFTVYHHSDGLREFYPTLTAEMVSNNLGDAPYVSLEADAVPTYLESLRELLMH